MRVSPVNLHRPCAERNDDAGKYLPVMQPLN
jgi:hypothetical protein